MLLSATIVSDATTDIISLFQYRTSIDHLRQWRACLSMVDEATVSDERKKAFYEENEQKACQMISF